MNTSTCWAKSSTCFTSSANNSSLNSVTTTLVSEISSLSWEQPVIPKERKPSLTLFSLQKRNNSSNSSCSWDPWETWTCLNWSSMIFLSLRVCSRISSQDRHQQTRSTMPKSKAEFQPLWKRDLNWSTGLSLPSRSFKSTRPRKCDMASCCLVSQLRVKPPF